MGDKSKRYRLAYGKRKGLLCVRERYEFRAMLSMHFFLHTLLNSFAAFLELKLVSDVIPKEILVYNKDPKKNNHAVFFFFWSEQSYSLSTIL